MKYFDIDELYDIAQRLKTYNDEFQFMSTIPSNSDSFSMYLSEASISLQNTLAEFEIFMIITARKPTNFSRGLLTDKIR